MGDYGRNVANDDQVREWAKTLRAERALADDLADEVEQLQQVIIDICADQGLQAPVFLDSKLARYREARGL